MNLKAKLLAIGLLVVALAAVAAIQSHSFVFAARIVLGASALLGGAYWYAKRSQPAAFQIESRMNVIQRVGLSQRSALALVEVDGQPYLVVHGDGFARIQRTTRNAPAHVVKDTLHTLSSDASPFSGALS